MGKRFLIMASILILRCSLFLSGEKVSVEEAEKCLNNTFTDSLNDFYTPPGGAPPDGVYEFGPVDIITVSVGCDDKYLYIKFEVAENFPKGTVVSQDNNVVKKITGWCPVDIDLDPSTGCQSDGGAEALLCFMIDLEKKETGAYFFAQPTGIEEPEEDRYAVHKDAIVVGGGSGKNWIILAYPLADIGLQKGMVVDIGFNLEAESDKWHHFSFDTCPGPTEHGKVTCQL